jgi:hypothetical protein
MVEKKISRDDIDGLARKLLQHPGFQSENDRAMLQIVFELAATAVASTAPVSQTSVRRNPTSAQIRQSNSERWEGDKYTGLAEGFKNAYQPGRAAFFSIK